MKEFEPEEMIRRLEEEGVEYVIVGGIAAVVHGDSGITADLDLTPGTSRANLTRLARALRALGAEVRLDETTSIPFDCSAEFFEQLGPEGLVNLTTRHGDLDVALRPDGTEGYEDLARHRRIARTLNGHRMPVASLEDVIRSKEAAGRMKDLSALPRLRALLARQKEQGESAPRPEQEQDSAPRRGD